jgi:hypothetical protein
MLWMFRAKRIFLWSFLAVALACGGAEIEPSDSESLDAE